MPDHFEFQSVSELTPGFAPRQPTSPRETDVAPREFHVSRAARARYNFDQSLYSITGNVVFPGYRAAQLFAQRMNEERDLARHPEQTVSAGQLNAMGLLDEILHAIVRAYRERLNPEAFGGAAAWLEGTIGESATDAVLLRFVEHFPPLAVYSGETSVADYLRGSTAAVPNRRVLLEELVMLWLANANPALAPFDELFDDADVARGTEYRQAIGQLQAFFATQPPFGPDNQSLIDLLRAPAIASPDSLAGQLRFVLDHWRDFVADVLVAYRGRLEPLLDEIARGIGVLAEENRPRFMGPGPAEVPVFGGPSRAGFDPWNAPERYTPDRDWMPELVLIAKNTYVWLDQLSKKYGRAITRLDEIPDEELDLLATWGFTGLWFIGIWERSKASARIKQMTGNPEAAASAYSVYDYVVAEALGGPAALDSLKDRARARGIRLASDMVPNHAAIDGKWVIEHPDWFVGLDHSPFPAYTYDGPDLSGDERVGIRLEDHYYDRTDAAVTFKRTDRWTGSERYIYHGNDGTSYPWNDTAQLDYLNPEVREAVIQTILHVARQFPVIRFDAAMVLTKMHYHRLWYPEPGTGSDIPSRAQHGLTKEEFDRRMPEEFWREVVDRAAVEAPDTLLLAEAFWLLEGYFVRTLGMHRVYNSAFMNMLRDEDNAKYRQVLKNTLEYDPEILWRYVNFMSNPDERTAVDQFGKGDKYIGIAAMMATLPGLPMFGHGQVEGFYERYGMEYRRAYYDESPDAELIGHHEREIAPLLRRRYLFSGVERFLLYDFFTTGGSVDENVFAHSNRAGDERALVVYHNRFAETRGWIRTSVAYSERQPSGERRLVQRTLGEGLGLTARDDHYAIFRDRVTGLEYIRSSLELSERGLYLELAAYSRHVFFDFREVQNTERTPYGRLAAMLGGAGVPSVEVELRRLALEPALQPFRALLQPDFLRDLIQSARTGGSAASDGRPSRLEEVERRARSLVEAIAALTGSDADAEALAAATRREVAAILDLARRTAGEGSTARARAAAAYMRVKPDDVAAIGTLLALALSRPFALAVRGADGLVGGWLDEWTLRDVISGSLAGAGLDVDQATRATSLVGMLSNLPLHYLSMPPRGGYGLLADLLGTDEGREFVHANWHLGILWVNREALVELRWWVAQEALLAASVEDGGRHLDGALVGWCTFARSVDRVMELSAYHLEQIEERLSGLSRRHARAQSAADATDAEATEKDATRRLDERNSR